MGHVSNPIGYRVGRTVEWPHIWASSASNYMQQSLLMEGVNRYAENIFTKVKVLKRSGLIFSHAEIRNFTDRVLLKVFVYSPSVIAAQKYNRLNYLSKAKKFYEKKEVRQKIKITRVVSKLVSEDKPFNKVYSATQLEHYFSCVEPFYHDPSEQKITKWNKRWVEAKANATRQFRKGALRTYNFYMKVLGPEVFRKRRHGRKKRWEKKILRKK